MRALQHRDTPEPGIWRPASEREIGDWRKELHRGWRREIDTAVHRNTERVQSDGDEVTMDTEPRERLAPRKAIEVVAREMMEWARSNPEQFLARVQYLRAVNSSLGHLSDEDAATQLYGLCEKIARADVEQVMKTNHWDRGVMLYGDTGRSG